MDTVRRPSRKIAIAGVVVALAAGLTGCTNAVAMSPAPSANDAACAAAQVRLPAVVDTKYDLRNTNAQSTAAWGDPEAAIYHCGVAVPTVSDLPCFSQGGVDWLRDDRGADRLHVVRPVAGGPGGHRHHQGHAVGAAGPHGRRVDAAGGRARVPRPSDVQG